MRAARPPFRRVPLLTGNRAPTWAGGGQWVPFFVKLNRRVGGVVIRAPLACLAPHPISAAGEAIKQGFLSLPDSCATVKTTNISVRFKFWKGFLLHDAEIHHIAPSLPISPATWCRNRDPGGSERANERTAAASSWWPLFLVPCQDRKSVV